jgi:hypothetical protein
LADFKTNDDEAKGIDFVWNLKSGQRQTQQRRGQGVSTNNDTPGAACTEKPWWRTSLPNPAAHVENVVDNAVPAAQHQQPS